MLSYTPGYNSVNVVNNGNKILGKDILVQI